MSSEYLNTEDPRNEVEIGQEGLGNIFNALKVVIEPTELGLGSLEYQIRASHNYLYYIHLVCNQLWRTSDQITPSVVKRRHEEHLLNCPGLDTTKQDHVPTGRLV